MDKGIDIAAVRFGATRLVEGYEIGQVDAFVDRVDDVLNNPAPVPVEFADEVLGTRFGTVRLGQGYDMNDVDAFLDRVADLARRQAAEDAASVAAAQAQALTELADPIWTTGVANAARELSVTGDRPAGERFARTSRFSGGYGRAEVDAFVDRTCAQISLPTPHVHAHDVLGTSFDQERHGYQMRAVDSWLERLVDHLRERGLP